jgi:hypothetical protein
MDAKEIVRHISDIVKGKPYMSPYNYVFLRTKLREDLHFDLESLYKAIQELNNIKNEVSK